MSIEKCVQDSVNAAVERMLPQGGFLNPTSYKIYNDTNVSYICLNKGYFVPCTNQHPMLINEMKNEIYNYINPRVEQCFASMKKEYEKMRWVVELGNMNLTIEMAPGRIFVDIEREIRATKNEVTSTFEGVDIEVINPAYDLANIAIDIANNEAKYCSFEYVGYMVLYPTWDIRIFTLSDYTKIYTIKDKATGKKMNIAIRSCAMPPGMGI